jgi:DNA-directed RNA polymerase specialized sigma subunit
MTKTRSSHADANGIAQRSLRRKPAQIQSSDHDFQCRYETVLRHRTLVRALALSIYGKLAGSPNFENLIRAGIFGLYSATEQFDPVSEVSFISFAKMRIRAAMFACIQGPVGVASAIRKEHAVNG